MERRKNVMRNYELMVILRPELSDEERNAQLESIQQLVGSLKGSVGNVDHWGRRRLMYEIDGERDGYYVVYQLELPASAPAEIERTLRFNENVIRYLVTRKEE
jgi:small subunit ribosomal protein S6